MIIMHIGGMPFLFYYFSVFSACLFQPVLPTAVARFFGTWQLIEMDTSIRNYEL